MFASIARNKDIDFCFDELDSAIPINLIGDDNRLKQVLINLINNAIKFTANGSVHLTTSLCSNQPPSGVRLNFMVTDTGIGISEYAQRTLFEPFKQAESSTSREYGGTGLGLSIVKRLTEIMGGSIHVSSELGKGSKFELELPFAIDDSVKIETKNDLLHIENTSMTSAQPNKGLHDANILVVDDSLINLEVIRRILANEGAQVVTCESGQSALDILASSRLFDIVLIDMQMPVMSGTETTIKIRSNPQFQHLSIIALTAGATTTEKTNAIASGMNDFLTKPVDPKKLIRILREYIHQNRSSSSFTPATQISEAKVTTAKIEATTDASSTSTSNWPELAGIDKELASNLMGGDFDFFKEIAQDFYQEHQHTISKIKTHLEAGQKIEAAQLTHRLKGQAGNIGAIVLNYDAGELEQLILNDVQDCNQKLTDLDKHLQILLEAIEKDKA